MCGLWGIFPVHLHPPCRPLPVGIMYPSVCTGHELGALLLHYVVCCGGVTQRSACYFTLRLAFLVGFVRTREEHS